MTLFGLGLWRRWRYLFVIASAPFSFIVLPFLVNKFTDWYLESWQKGLLLLIGACVLIPVMTFVVRFSYRRWPGKSPKLSHPLFGSLSAATKVATVLMGIALTKYCCSYTTFSLEGQFEPEVIGLNGVKFYSWAPKGFVDKFEWDNSRVTFYRGLWALDNLFWHKSGPGYDLPGNYPVDFVPQGDIGKLYRAWDPSSASRIVSPNKKYQIWIRAFRTPKRAFVDRTRKSIGISIIKNNGDYADWDAPASFILYTNHYQFECSDVRFQTSWDEENNIAVTLYDYAPDVYQEDAQRAGIPSNYIATLSFDLDKQTGKFRETKPH